MIACLFHFFHDDVSLNYLQKFSHHSHVTKNHDFVENAQKLHVNINWTLHENIDALSKAKRKFGTNSVHSSVNERNASIPKIKSFWIQTSLLHTNIDFIAGPKQVWVPKPAWSASWEVLQPYNVNGFKILVVQD